MRRRTVYLALTLLGFPLTTALGAEEGDVEASSTFKILIREPGVYRVEHQDLVQAGLDPAWDGANLRLTQQGTAVPFWRPDRQDRFGPGDSLIFRGEALHGEHSFFNDHTDVNVYVLELGGEAGPEMRVVPAPALPEKPPATSLLDRHVHHERDELLLRFAERDDEPSKDGWFWAKLTQIDKQPFQLPLDFTDFEPESGPLSLIIALRGWSRQRRGRGAEMPDHVVEVSLNDQPIATAEFKAQDEHLIEIERVAPEIVQPGRNLLTLRVPKRLQDDGETVIDVVLLNWIEMRHGRGPRLRTEQEHLIAAGSGNRVARLLTTEPLEVEAFGADGTRRLVTSMSLEQGQSHLIALDATDGPPLDLTAVVDGAFRQPLALVADAPSNLRSPANRADYIMIAHSSLMEAVEPLAAFHRSRGLVVEVIDVVDVYDEFNHGVLHPVAIRDFLRFAFHDWTPPAPRFVLLVGDASWDTKHEDPADRQYADWTYRPGEVRRFVKNKSTGYASELTGALRNLVPTWKYSSAQGHAASDNFFVAVEGDDFLPDMAIGRFPVVTAEEVAAIVAKTIRYMTANEVGPWRRNVLWITNEAAAYQRRTDQLAESMAERGFGATKIYPSPDEADNVHHQQALLTALNQGHLLVHFLGHGGRYIWRTGPPDFRKNHDLFTLDHLDQLEPTDRLPVILSMTCYSAPFDHPSADSIGEKFLRLADRGAVAVLAASWRNAPGNVLSRALLQHLSASDSIGTAILKSKRTLSTRNLIETYNLLGDPAVRLALPAEKLDLTLDASNPGRVRLRASLASGDKMNGTVLMEWFEQGGDGAKNRQTDVNGTVFESEIQLADEARLERLSLYYWDEDQNHDALVSVTLDPEAKEETTAKGSS